MKNSRRRVLSPSLLRYSGLYMGRIDTQHRTGPSWRILLAFLCVMLVVVLGTMQVAHTHADGADHADCALCSAVHITVHPVHSPPPTPTTSVVAVLEALPQSILSISVAIFALFMRPPPCVSVPA